MKEGDIKGEKGKREGGRAGEDKGKGFGGEGKGGNT